jgi:hypothetical protein
METKNETSEINGKALEFLENLNTDQLDRLLGSQRYQADVLRYAQHSEALTQKISQLLGKDYASLSAEDQKRTNDLRVRLMRDLRSSDGLTNLVRFPSGDLEEEAWVSLAAATDKIVDTDSSPSVFGEVVIDGMFFKFAEDITEGIVLLQGAVPQDATHIQFGSFVFELKRTADQHSFEVDGVGFIEVKQFLKRTKNHPNALPIEFVRGQQ